MATEATATFETNGTMCIRNCSNCVKGRVVGHNYWGKELYTCKPNRDSSEILCHLSKNVCKDHVAYVERFGEEL